MKLDHRLISMMGLLWVAAILTAYLSQFWNIVGPILSTLAALFRG